MAQWIITDFERPDRNRVEAFKTIPTTILSDCMNRFQSMEAAVRPLTPETKLCGPAFTVQSMEGCNWAAHQALTLSNPGDVLVLAVRGSMTTAVWGHVMTFAARKRGLAGVVINGCIRDKERNREDRLPIFCRGVCPGGPHKGWPGNIGVPVSCGGVPVVAGDIIVGDGDGVVVVPLNRAEQVLTEARNRITMENTWYDRIAEGETTVNILGLGTAGEKESRKTPLHT